MGPGQRVELRRPGRRHAQRRTYYACRLAAQDPYAPARGVELRRPTLGGVDDLAAGVPVEPSPNTT